MPGRKADTKLISTGVLDENGEEIGIYYSEIADYLTPEFLESWRFYQACKRMSTLHAAPYSGGWNSWPIRDVKILLLFSEEEDKWKAEKRDERLNDG